MDGGESSTVSPFFSSFVWTKSDLKFGGLSDRETKSLEAEVEAHEKRINDAVFACYGGKGLPGD